MMLFFLLLSWRILLFVVAFFTHYQFPFTPQFPYSDIYLLPSRLPSWVWSFANFDGVHYLTIAKSGYAAQYTQAFFPLYSLLIRWLGGEEHRFIVTGLAISFFFLVAGVVLFSKLLRLDYDKGTTEKTILFLLLFPVSFFFGAVYTESLFFFLVIAAFWFARNKYWWLSGVCAALASLTRVTGIFLWPALLWELYRSYPGVSGIKKVINFILSPICYLPPAGLLGYMVYLHYVFGDSLYFWHAQPMFGAARTGGTFVFPLQVVFRYLKILVTVPLMNYGFWVALWELSAVAGGLIGLIYGYRRKLRTSYLLFGWFVLLVPTVTGTFSSLPRYLLAAFPLFMAASMLKSKITTYVLLSVSAILLIIFTSLFLRGLWVA